MGINWTVVTIAVNKSDEWRTYRQALRDTPLQEGFPNTIVWPSQP